MTYQRKGLSLQTPDRYHAVQISVVVESFVGQEGRGDAQARRPAHQVGQEDVHVQTVAGRLSLHLHGL